MAEATRVNKTFFEATGHNLRTTSQLRLFNILEDIDRETEFMNIFKVLRLNESTVSDIAYFDTYEVEGEREAWWDTISNEIYDTPYLWWIIALFNNVTNPFEEKLDAGENLSILKREHLYTLFKDIENIAEL